MSRRGLLRLSAFMICDCPPLATTLIARFMGRTWGPPGANRTQVGPTLATWTLLSVYVHVTPLAILWFNITPCWLFHWGGVTHLCFSKQDNHCFRWWLDACWVPSQYLNLCWIVVNTDHWKISMKSETNKMYLNMSSANFNRPQCFKMHLYVSVFLS